MAAREEQSSVCFFRRSRPLTALSTAWVSHPLPLSVDITIPYHFLRRSLSFRAGGRIRGPINDIQFTDLPDHLRSPIGLPMQLVLKVPNWGSPARRLADFVSPAFRVDWDKLTAENSNEISLPFLKAGLSSVESTRRPVGL
jgi:hypothetical protein